MARQASQHIFIRLVANHQAELFLDATGKHPLDAGLPLALQAGSKLGFHFILNHNLDPLRRQGTIIETAELVVLPQVKWPSDQGSSREQARRDSPFAPSNRRAFVFPDPGEQVKGNSGNLQDGLKPETDRSGSAFITAGELEIGPAKELDGLYTFSIIANTDQGSSLALIEPTVQIQP